MKLKSLSAILALLTLIPFITSCSTSETGSLLSDAISRVWSDIRGVPPKEETPPPPVRTPAQARTSGPAYTERVGTTDGARLMLVSGHPNYPPVMWRDGNEIVGVGPEILKIYGEEIGVTVSSRFKGSWSQVQQGATEGEIDVIVGAYETEQRKKYMDFSVPYMKDPIVIFVAKGSTFPYQKWDDLIGKRGAATVGESYGKEFDAFIAKKLTVSKSVNVEDGFNKILSGEADYLISPLYSGIFEAERAGLSDKVEYLPTFAATENFHIAIPKESRFIRNLPEIDKKIEALIDDGTIERLIEENVKRYKEVMPRR